MRGIADACFIAGERPGITPAHAGNSLRQIASDAYTEDHPRPCGE